MAVGGQAYSVGAVGMTMTLESNPLMLNLDADSINAALTAILTKVSAVQYIPTSVELNGDPALDPGDLITVADSPNGDLVVPVMRSTWQYRGRHTIVALGKSARLRSEYTQNAKGLSAISAAVNAATQLAKAASQSSQLIHDAIGGTILLRAGPDQKTNEVLIMDNPDPALAVKIWRWNMAGLGFSDNCVGADNTARVYTVAITNDGVINGNFLQVGTIGADVIFAGQLFAAHGTFTELIAGNPTGAHMSLGVDVFNEPVINVFNGDDPLDSNGKPIPVRSIRKDGDYYSRNSVIQRTYTLGTRRGSGVFIA
jgi:hypothetical protein